MIRKIFAFTAVALVLAVAAGAGYWHFRLAPYYWANYTRHKSMQQIKEGIATFSTKHDRLPVSLEELVSDGSLPAESKIYYSAMKHRSLNARSLSYRDCEFELQFDKDAVIVSIPDAVFADKTFDFLPANQRSLVITAGVKILDPSKARL